MKQSNSKPIIPFTPASPEDLPGAVRRGSSPEELPGAVRRGSSPDRRTVDFQPVQLRARHDGWTAQRQIAFIEALAESSCVEEACRRVGMSDSAAYALRRQPGAAAFRRAWDAALHYSAYRLDQAAYGRALKGVPRPVFYKGEQVGEWRHFDERLTMFLLKHRRKQWYGRGTEQPLPDVEDDDRDGDPAIMLEGGLDGIEWLSQDDCGEADEAGE